MGSPLTVAVGLSGGVDSAVAALLLLRAGYAVHALHMTNWEDDDGYCTAADDYREARQVCRHLDIPLHRVNFAAEYRDQVFAAFLREYRAGRTPNPDVLCNRLIKFGSFVTYARRLGADRIATGHYARVADGDRARLLKARDATKDQSYFLHRLDADTLATTLFPLGDLLKTQVRALAREHGLTNHDRADSTGICFIGERPFREFLSRHIHEAPGPVLTPDGEEVGRHRGIMFYTLGQRAGLGIGGRRSGHGEPWYVARKDPVNDALIVVQGREHPLLWSRALIARAVAWVAGIPPVAACTDRWRGRARIRHRHPEAACTLRRLADGSWSVEFEQRQWAVTPGQSVVFYDGDECLGGGVIDSAVSDEVPREIRLMNTA
jgi:tRNA-specific 2-thiouridylase